MTHNAATDFAVALLGELIASGVRDIVLCPGARSQALALAAASYEEAARVRLRVRIDERVAGFLALGLAVETGLPVVIITTSGTAVANLHPAVLEAHHSGVPLILLTADRPAELRGIGSNQTTDQVGIFAGAVHFRRDVDAPQPVTEGEQFDPLPARKLARDAFSAAAGQPGPVQLNLAFREPLSGGAIVLPLPLPLPGSNPAAVEPTAGQLIAPRVIQAMPATIVIAGDRAGAAAEEFARALNVPLIAEVSSGARFGPNLVVSYRRLLSDADFGGRVRRAIVFGHPTLAREIPALLQRADVTVHIVRSDAAEAYNPGRRAASIDSAVVVDPAEVSPPDSDEARDAGAWLGRWVHTSRALRAEDAVPDHKSTPRDDGSAKERPGDFAREQLASFRTPITRTTLVESVWRVTWPHDRLVLGASRLIREADSTVTGKKITVHANRGLAGIDGTIATALGIALASQDRTTSSATGITRVLIGDLTALYDVGALLFGAGEPRPRVQVIVGNDGGGTIFDGLEVAASAAPAAFDRVQYTPQSADFRSLAAAYGWNYQLARNRGELDEALAPSDAPTLIEVILPR